MTTTSIIDIIAFCGFFGIIITAMLCITIWFVIHTILQHKCKHDWECILNSSITYDGDDKVGYISVLRCTRCGKIKKIKVKY